MKPRTKQQIRVYAISQSLPLLVDKIKPWVFDNCIEHIGYRTNKNTSCLSCGHVFKGDVISSSDRCPSCLRQLKIENTLKKKHDQKGYAVVLDVVDGFQIIRHFQMHVYHKGGVTPSISFSEIIQQYMQPDGHLEIVARNRGGFGYYQMENFHGPLEIKNSDHIENKYDVYPDMVYPEYKCLPIYQRNGFIGNVGDRTPFEVFTKILSDSYTETLIKANQYSLMSARISYSKCESIVKYWKSIKICMRNNYVVDDAKTYLDYLDLLSHFGKDLCSPKYLCPRDLDKAHNRMVSKKRAIDRNVSFEKNKANIERNEPIYKRDKGLYFGLIFIDGNITIKVLETVRDFFEEGEKHKHCVFTNSYYQKENSLVFAAFVNGVPMETIDISLSEMRVSQSRGWDNKPTKYHDQIVRVMQNNLRHIKARRYNTKNIAA